MNIMGSFRDIISEEVKEFCRYMDTTVPSGVNRAVFTDLKYTNKEKIREFEAKHENIDRMLIDNVALDMFLSLPDEEKLKELGKYMEE